jgi:hypothetical protein
MADSETVEQAKRDISLNGFARVPDFVPEALCDRLVEVLREQGGVPIDDPSRWHVYETWDIVPMWGHQAEWEIRQLPSLYRLWSGLWGQDALFVSLDMVRFTPPRHRPSPATPLPIHWDHDPYEENLRSFQGVVALTDTGRGQGGFRCVPSLYSDRARWPTAPVENDGRREWLPEVAEDEIVEVPARKGDVIVWDSLLPHANSRNTSTRPRIAFYVQMFPVDKYEPYEEARRERVELWKSGRCHPVWRWRPGCDRVEPWPPARLTGLGRRLLGLDSWAET